MDKEKNVLTQFSLTDFLAYLFPGTIGLAALIALSQIIEPAETIKIIDPASYVANNLPKSVELFVTVITGLFGIAASYVLGIMFSSITFLLGIEKIINRLWKARNPYRNGHLTSLHSEIDKVNEYLLNLKSRPNEKDLDSGSLFYIYRGVVRAEDIKTTVFAERQSSLRQIRRNLILPLILWGIVLVLYYPYNNSFLYIALTLIILSIIGIVKGINRNREFEVRDYCLGAWRLYKKTGLDSYNY
jgi:hypothetical protein